MKCVCGYYHEEDYKRDSDYFGGEQEFIQITGSTFKIEDEYNYSGSNTGYREVKLFACPKCSTIKMEKWKW